VEKVKVTRKYQVTIPKEVRESIGVKVGDELLVSGSERRIVFEKPVDLEELAGAWVHVESTDGFMENVKTMWKTWKVK
jgi:AbrB family looped-hinge helix DNA binding protein